MLLLVMTLFSICITSKVKNNERISGWESSTTKPAQQKYSLQIWFPTHYFSKDVSHEISSNFWWPQNNHIFQWFGKVSGYTFRLLIWAPLRSRFILSFCTVGPYNCDFTKNERYIFRKFGKILSPKLFCL